MPAFAAAFTLSSALGSGIAATRDALVTGRGGLRRQSFAGDTLDTWTGLVQGLDAVRLSPSLARYDCRNNRLAERALLQDGFLDAVERVCGEVGASRIGLWLGTSSAGILDVELGYRARDRSTGALPEGLRYRETMNLYSPAAFVRERLGLQGPSVVISAACASSAKAFAAGARALEAGVCDAAIVGGVEALCLTTLHGFRSLELLSDRPCRPCDAQRSGISLGEAAGYVLLTRVPSRTGLALLGYGESADAHHISTPHPEGLGAADAMREALRRANLAPDAIDYVNLHGTGTRTNDLAEDAALHAVLGDATPRSSTKGWTGHALGAAGVAEAVITLIAIDAGIVPGTLNCEDVDPAIRGNVVLATRPGRVTRALSNSFGFGGSNCALVFGHAA